MTSRGKSRSHPEVSPSRRPRLGQHFLMKGSVLERLAQQACEAGEPVVIEIGPGKGALTERLLARAQRVIAVEVDARLVEYLRQKFRDHPRLELVQADILATDWGRWGPAALAGNLPYFITSPILERIVRYHHLLKRAVLLVQKEVASRLTARPGTRDYGFLTLKVRLFFEPRLLFDVKPGAFSPPPAVESAAVLLDPVPRAAGLGIKNTTEFLRFLGDCFHHKRKTIRNNLLGRYDAALVASWPEASLRAEQIALEQFAEMFRRLPAHQR